MSDRKKILIDIYDIPWTFRSILNLFHRIVKGLIKAGMNLKRKFNGMEGKEVIFQVN